MKTVIEEENVQIKYTTTEQNAIINNVTDEMNTLHKCCNLCQP